MSKYDGVKCVTVDCDEQAVCDDRCGACYQWRRGRIANLTKESKDVERYLYRLRRTSSRVAAQFNVNWARTNVRRHTASHSRRHLGAAA